MGFLGWTDKARAEIAAAKGTAPDNGGNTGGGGDNSGGGGDGTPRGNE